MSQSRHSATELLTAGERYAHALAAKDRDSLVGAIASPVDFQALTPGRHWQADRAEQIVDEFVLGRWFGPDDDILDLTSVESHVVSERQHVAYRLRVRRDRGLYLVEQQMYYDLDTDGRMTYVRLLCSGYCPVA
jgi:hypothetical protein